jgi:hypothetical protein
MQMIGLSASALTILSLQNGLVALLSGAFVPDVDSIAWRVKNFLPRPEGIHG